MKRQSKPVGRRGICDRCGKVFYGSVFLYLCPACRSQAMEELRRLEEAEEKRRQKEAERWRIMTFGK